MKNSPKLTRDLNDARKLDYLRAHIECQQPTVNLYQFVGTLTVYQINVGNEGSDDERGGVTSLGLDNLLLRGARLKDTDYVYGKELLFISISSIKFKKKMYFTFNFSM